MAAARGYRLPLLRGGCPRHHAATPPRRPWRRPRPRRVLNEVLLAPAPPGERDTGFGRSCLEGAGEGRQVKRRTVIRRSTGAEVAPIWPIWTPSFDTRAASQPAPSRRSDFLLERSKMLYGDYRPGRDSVSEYSTSCIDIRADELLISAEEGGQAAARAGRKDLASVIAREQRQITTAGLVPVGLSRLPVSPGHSGPAARMPSCLTRAGHRPVVWPHEIPDSGISHRNTGSSPRSGTEAGDTSPVFAALEHAAGDFTTLGKNPLLEGSSPPSDTFSKLLSELPQRVYHLEMALRAGRPRLGCPHVQAPGD